MHVSVSVVIPFLQNNFVELLCIALTLLHRAGYTHRDISIGNILTDEYGSARLGDLEYTISTSSTVPLHPVRTVSSSHQHL